MFPKNFVYVLQALDIFEKKTQTQEKNSNSGKNLKNFSHKVQFCEISRNFLSLCSWNEIIILKVKITIYAKIAEVVGPKFGTNLYGKLKLKTQFSAKFNSFGLFAETWSNF